MGRHPIYFEFVQLPSSDIRWQLLSGSIYERNAKLGGCQIMALKALKNSLSIYSPNIGLLGIKE